MSDQELTSEQKAIGVGMAIAAGIVISCFGDETAAAEILGAAGLRTVRDMKDTGVDRYDLRLCLPVLRRFREQDRTRAAVLGGAS